MIIHPYLTFNGNCQEAMTFYQKCLGGELMLQRIGESPFADHMPTQMQDSILHSTLKSGNLTILGSDMVGELGLIKGNTASLMLDCDSEEHLRNSFEKLGTEGRMDHPIEKTFWGALFGDLTDKFGIHWLLHYQLEPITTNA